MKNLIQTSFIIGIMLALSSFTRTYEFSLIGTYGFSEDNPAKIELVLNENKTFTYQDYSNPAKHIDVNGNWEVKNKKILLKSDDSESSFHSKWKIAKNGMVLKSRKGITFYTLAKK